jgi:hypothetical protein
MTKKLKNRDSKEVRDFNKKVFDFFQKYVPNHTGLRDTINENSGVIESTKPYMQKNPRFTFRATSSISSLNRS